MGDFDHSGENAAADDYDESQQLWTMMVEDDNHGDNREERAPPGDLVVPGGALIQLQFPKEPPSHQIQSGKEITDCTDFAI